ncbi:MAG: hypothetical protein WBO54_12505 [Thermoanaerobaculia bacterium]
MRVKAANPVTNGSFIKFGAAVALDGEVLVIGAPGEDSETDPMGFDTGSAYVFEREGAGWVEKQKLTSPSEAPFEVFGTSVGVALGDDGVDYLVVGATGGAGSAYVFKRMSGGSWVYQATLAQDEPQAGDRFGASVAIDYFEPNNSQNGDKVFVVAVGAPFNRDETGTSSQQGSVSIFQAGSTTWGGSQDFFGEHGDLMGTALAMAADTVVAGSEGLDGTGFNGGGAWTIVAANQQPSGVYKYNLGSTMQPSAPEVGVGQGLSVAAEYKPALLVQAAAIGFPLSDEVALNAGLVLVFPLGGGTESAVIEPTGLGQGASFGTSVALSNQILAVGAPGVGTDGAVFLYDKGATIETWILAGSLTIPDLPPVSACFGGAAIALDGVTAAVGCPSNNNYDNEGTFVYSGSSFSDGFESGDTSVWSATVP